MCVKEVGGKKRFVGRHSKSKINLRKNSYPDCDEQGVVTRNEVKQWNLKFRVSRQIQQLEKLLRSKEKSKEK